MDRSRVTEAEDAVGSGTDTMDAGCGTHDCSCGEQGEAGD